MEQTKKRILCVDDDRDTCLMLETLFGLSGYEVISAMTVADASRLAKKDSFDLYLLDWNFPDGTGIELCQYIRMFDTETPILFCSGVVGETDIRRAMSAGAQGYMVKPIGVENLMQTIRACLPSDDVRASIQ
jgi:DNA-binding response OmpR family regulator